MGVPGRSRTEIFKSVQFMKMSIFISNLLCFRMRRANSVMPTALGKWPGQQIQAAVIHKASDSLIHISQLNFWLPGKASWAPVGKRVWSENERVKWKIAANTRNSFRKKQQLPKECIQEEPPMSRNDGEWNQLMSHYRIKQGKPISTCLILVLKPSQITERLL